MSEGQTEGQNSLSIQRENLGNVPNGPWVHEQEHEGPKTPSCNPVTMSPDMDLVAKIKKYGKVK